MNLDLPKNKSPEIRQQRKNAERERKKDKHFVRIRITERNLAGFGLLSLAVLGLLNRKLFQLFLYSVIKQYEFVYLSTQFEPR